MTVVIDDHLLRDVLAGDDDWRTAGTAVATTNLYYLRLSKSVAAASGRQLTGAWPVEARQALGRALTTLDPDIDVVPLRSIAFRMAQLAVPHRLSTLGAEAIAAAEHLGAELWVWADDDGPAIRAAAAALGLGYRTVDR